LKEPINRSHPIVNIIIRLQLVNIIRLKLVSRVERIHTINIKTCRACVLAHAHAGIGLFLVPIPLFLVSLSCAYFLSLSCLFLVSFLSLSCAYSCVRHAGIGTRKRQTNACKKDVDITNQSVGENPRRPSLDLKYTNPYKCLSLSPIFSLSRSLFFSPRPPLYLSPSLPLSPAQFMENTCKKL